MKHRRIYRMLVDLGCSPLIAATIVLDASRGDEYARTWIKVARRLVSRRGS